MYSLFHQYINGVVPIHLSIHMFVHLMVTNGAKMFPLVETGHVTTIAASHWSVEFQRETKKTAALN